MMCRSFENNWNTYKLLAHINPPDTKVSDLHLLNQTRPDSLLLLMFKDLQLSHCVHLSLAE